ncbi:MAG: SPOR domain-containing protein [Rhodothermales bacterium]
MKSNLRPFALAALLAAGLFAGCSAVRPDPGAPPEEDRPVVVQGYRIQVATARDKGEADRHADRLLAWWNERSEAERAAFRAGKELAVDVNWIQPYYRVRAGHFEDADSAQPLLDALKERFPSAFLVPESYTTR